MTPNGSAGYFATRMSFDARRRTLWQSLWRFYFSRIIRPTDAVLELGCGHADFINAVQAKRRITVDMWPEYPRFVDSGIEAHVGSVTDLGFLPNDSIDVAFASNLLEHLPQSACAEMLDQVRRAMRRGGRLILVQPNYRFAFREYFDDYTHVTVYSHVSLSDFLTAHGFRVTHCEPRFLPLTLKSRMPVMPWLIWTYLHLPVKPLARQMLLIAEPNV